MPGDYYEILGVGRDANKAEVKTAFRRLARELHPDVNDHDPEAEEKFKAAAEAYEVNCAPRSLRGRLSWVRAIPIPSFVRLGRCHRARRPVLTRKCRATVRSAHVRMAR